jgi:LVIVD repeat
MNTTPSFPQGPSLLSTIIEQNFDSTIVKIGTLINDNLNLLDVDLLISPNITVGTIEISSNRIRPIEDPIISTDAGTKNYVDTKEIIPSGPENSVLYKSSDNSFVGSSDLLLLTNNTLSINGTLNANTLTCSSIQIGNINIYAVPEVAYSLTVPSSDGVIYSMLGVNSSNILTFFPNTLPSGASGEIQYNNSGSFGSDSDFKFINNTLYANLHASDITCNKVLNDYIIIPEASNTYAYLFNFTDCNYDMKIPRSSGLSTQVMGIDTSGNVFWTNNGTLSSSGVGSIQYNSHNEYDSSANFNYDGDSSILNVDNLITQTIEGLENPISNTISIGFGIGKACSDLEYTYICLTNSIKVINATQSLTIAITGTVVNAVVDTSYLYVISQSGSTGYLSIISTSDFQLVAQPKTIPLILTNIFVQGSYAYIVGSSSLYIIDITTPSLITVAIVPNLPNATSVRVSGNYIYVSCNNDIFSLIILEWGSWDTVVNTMNISLLGLVALEVLGQYVYAISNTSMFIIDVSDPSVPVVVRTITLGINLSSIAVTDQFAYVCCSNNLSSSGSLYVINMEDYSVSTYNSSLLLSAKSIFVGSFGLSICTDLLLNTLNTSVLSSSSIANILVTDLKVSSKVFCRGDLNTRSSVTSLLTSTDNLVINLVEDENIITITSNIAPESVLQITINNELINSDSIILTSIYNCSDSNVIPVVNVTNVIVGSAVIKVKNIGLINFSGTMKIFCLVV